MITARQSDKKLTLAPWEVDTTSAEDLTQGVKVVTKDERQSRLGQTPVTLLFTGLSGSGKTTLARGVERVLFDGGRTAVVLDGEELRRGLSRDLGFTSDDRSENLRRCAQMARLLNENGFICLAALIAPDAAVRDKAAELIGRERFLVVHLEASLEVCKQRDPRGHYVSADDGQIPKLPGAGSPYEAPSSADLVLRTDELSIEESVEQVVALLRSRKIIR
jgi:bifunctional enzyme CysN/CysC